MPPVAAAFAAVGGALGAAAGTASVLTGISAVGMGLSVVGKITGSKTLAKIGGVMGIVGGVGAMASGAGLLGSASSAGSVAEGAAGAGLAAGETGAMDMGIGFGSESAAGGVSEAISAVSKTAPTAGLEAGGVAQDIAKFSGSSFGGSQPSQDNQFIKSDYGYTGDTASEAPTMAQQVNYGNEAQKRLDNQFLKSDYGYSGVDRPGGTDKESIKSWWSRQDPKVQSAIIQGGVGAVGGLFDGWSAEEKLALERQKMELAQSNANAQPVVKFKPVAGVSARPVGGLLNSSRS